MTTQFGHDGMGEVIDILPTVSKQRSDEPISEVEAAQLDQTLKEAGSGLPQRTDELAAMLVAEVLPQLTTVTDGEATRYMLTEIEIIGIIAKATKRASAQTAQDIGEAMVKSKTLADELENLWKQST